MRVSEEFLRMVDDWRRRQKDLPSRAEAIGEWLNQPQSYGQLQSGTVEEAAEQAFQTVPHRIHRRKRRRSRCTPAQAAATEKAQIVREGGDASHWPKPAKNA